MHEILARLLPFGALCGSPGVIAGGLFATALFGSFAHCMPMCGPFVLMQAREGGDGPGLGRLTGAFLPRYHAGRLITYIVLGAVAGAAGDVVTSRGALRLPLAFLLGAAALAFLLQAVAHLGKLPVGPLAALTRLLADLVVPLAARRPGGFRLGLLLGLLPCGFLYAALAAAAATGSVIGGASAMAAFGAGTVPGLVVVGLTGRSLARRWRARAAEGVVLLFLLNAVTLSAAALHLVLA